MFCGRSAVLQHRRNAGSISSDVDFSANDIRLVRTVEVDTERREHSIMRVLSISALVGGACQTDYTPTKAAMVSPMQSAACALGKYNIRCNALLPGTKRTQLNDEDLGKEEKRRYMEDRIPLWRLGQPEDSAGPAVSIASDLSSYVTEAQLLVDGGLFVNLQ